MHDGVINIGRWKLFFIFMLAAASLISCRRNNSSPDVLRMNIETEPAALDWSIATEHWSIHVIMNIMSGLTRYDDDMTAQPALAERWDISDDGLTYTFYLRKGVRWTDAAPLTAQQFVDGWRRLLDPATGSEYAYFLYDVAGAQDYNEGKTPDFAQVRVRAVDALTLEVTLNKPIVYFPDVVSFVSTFPIRLDIIEKYGDAWTEPEHIQTLGAYKLESWQHEYRIVISRNEKYFGAPPKIGRVEMFMVNEENSSLDLYETGVLDIVRVPMLAAHFYQNRPDYKKGPAYWMNYVGFNVKKPPFDNPDVRRAFAHSLDRKQMTDMLRGGREPWMSWIPPRMKAANANIGCEFNVEKAREYLRRAGYKSPKDVPEVVHGYNTAQVNTMAAANIQEQWTKNLGVKVRLDNMEWKVYLDRIKDDTPALFRMGWMADFADPDNFMRLFISSSGNNHTQWGNPEYDRLVEDAARERDPQKRQRLYDRAQRILLVDDCVIVPTYVQQINDMVSPRVAGFKLNPMDLFFLERYSLTDAGGTSK